MYIRYAYSILTLVLLLIWGCKKEPSKKEIEILDIPEILLLNATTVKVSWETNYPSNSVVYYGVTESLGDTVAEDEEREQHSVVISGLLPDTVYYYQVESSSDNFKGAPKSDLDQFTTRMNEASYTLVGWTYFSTADYGSAIGAFDQALIENSSHGEAYIGRGWSLLRLGSVESALADFNTGLDLDNIHLVGYAGRAMIYLSLQSFQKAIDDGLVVIDADPVFVFDHDTNIDYIMVRLVLAQAYYAIQDYESAQEQCDTVDPNNNIDPIFPSTWKVNNVSYDSYLEALLALIQYLLSQNM